MTSDNRIHRNDEAEAAGADWLDGLLDRDAEAARDEYITDAGFTQRVMEALPAPVALPAWRKPVAVVLWSVAAAGVAMALPGVAVEVGREAYRLLAAQPVSLSGMVAAAGTLFALSWTAVAFTLRNSN